MKAKQLTILLAAVWMTTCAMAGSEDLKDCGVVASRYLGKSAPEIIRAFERSDIETKYRIYICSNQYQHPPALYLAASFAAEGDRAATFLSHKLAETEGDATVRDIVRVFAEMQRQGTYDVNGNARLMTLLGERSSGIRNDYWREYTVSLVRAISVQ